MVEDGALLMQCGCWWFSSWFRRRQAGNVPTALKNLLKRFYISVSCFCSNPSTSSELLPARNVQPPEDSLAGTFLPGLPKLPPDLEKHYTSISVAIAEVYLSQLSKHFFDKHISGKLSARIRPRLGSLLFQGCQLPAAHPTVAGQRLASFYLSAPPPSMNARDPANAESRSVGEPFLHVTIASAVIARSRGKLKTLCLEILKMRMSPDARSLPLRDNIPPGT